ncbi:MAG: hypothetical protein ACFB4I_24585 [Cyanophyceae cyanobacterium]
MTTTVFPNAPDISADDYCVFAVATCFVREDGEIDQVEIIEPVPSAYLEAVLKGVPTSYRLIWAQAVGEAMNEAFPPETHQDAQRCHDFAERTIAAARTYKSRSEAQALLSLGTVRDDLNYSLDKKRLLNAENVVRTEDNVKQHSHTHKVL